MSYLPHISAEDWIAIGTVGNFIVVIVLAGITWRYASDIKRQADASTAQAEAAKAQARAAEQHLAALQKEREEQRILTSHLLFAFIDSAEERFSQWENRMTGENYPQIPMPIEVVPRNFQQIIQDAYRIDGALAVVFSTAAEEAHKAEQEIKIISTAAQAQVQSWKGHQISAYNYLRAAGEALRTARERLSKVRDGCGHGFQ